jgi:hypothetical protein
MKFFHSKVMVTKNSTVNKPDGIRALENPVLKTH